MQAIGSTIDITRIQAAAAAQAEREAAAIANYARDLGVPPEALRTALDRRGLSLSLLEERLARYRDHVPALRALWARWQADAMDPLEATARNAIPTVPARLLEASAAEALGRCSDPVRWVASRYSPIADGARLLIGPTESGKALGFAQAALRLAKSGMRGIVWFPVTTLCNSHRQHRRTAAGSPDVVAAAGARWLVLTRLGGEGPDRDGLIELLGERYDQRRVTCVTTQLREAEIANKYGAGFLRQIVESGPVKGRVLDIMAAKSAGK